ncbi:MAG: CBS domain-containing protein [Deltaproteobacteria bacterium]|nr:CBS domain-containing protein [Deltaproteobacteria bacterium]
MFGKRVKLFELFGFEVRLDASWLIIALLVTWSLAAGVFPYLYPGLARDTYWTMGVIGALGLFISIIAHEFSHSLVARRYGMHIKGITLFVFGGVAEMGDEPPTARAEFMMAIVGPLSSIAIGAVFYLIYLYGESIGWSTPVNAVIFYIAYINGILAAFNLLPAFPLDGGRVLRSILWGFKGNLRWATRVSAATGSAFALALMFLGVLQFIGGNIIGGAWMFLIGMFLRNAAQMSYQQLLVRKALEGEPVRRFMIAAPVTVPGSITVEQLVEDYIFRYQHRMYPVLDGEELLGCVTTRQVKDIPREAWGRQTVREAVIPCSPGNSVPPNLDAIQALAKMQQNGISRMLVVENGRLAGLITLKDLLNFFSLKVELEERD